MFEETPDPCDRGLSTKHVDNVRSVVRSKIAAATSPVAASWVRSARKYGLEPESVKAPERLSGSHLSERRDQLDALLSFSTPVMNRLYSNISMAGCSVFLTDAEGFVLDARIPDSDSNFFQRAGLCEGADWSEACEGTNGIGTCIAEGRSVLIYRDEHFRERNTQMSCMGAPVFDEKGRLAAVLDVSSCRHDLERPMARLIHQSVCDAARQIEADHFQYAYAGNRIVRDPQDGTKGSMLFAIDRDDLIVGATRQARLTYGLKDDSFTSPRPAGDVLGDAHDRGIGLDNAERRELKRAIARANGNVSAAAKSLGISRATLYRRMQRVGLTDQA